MVCLDKRQTNLKAIRLFFEYYQPSPGNTNQTKRQISYDTGSHTSAATTRFLFSLVDTLCIQYCHVLEAIENRNSITLMAYVWSNLLHFY